MRKRDLLVVPALIVILAGAANECSEQTPKSVSSKGPLVDSMNVDDGYHNIGSTGVFRYGKKLNPSAKWVQCRWRVEIQDKQTGKWYTLVKGGSGHYVRIERSPQGNKKRLYSKSCGRWH